MKAPSEHLVHQRRQINVGGHLAELEIGKTTTGLDWITLRGIDCKLENVEGQTPRIFYAVPKGDNA